MSTSVSINWSEFEILSTAAPTSITWASRGIDGSGKSHFLCTAPGPIFVAAFDPYGMERVDPEVREGKEIRVRRYSFAEIKADISLNLQQKREAAKVIWDRFNQEYCYALKYVRTCAWDREDLAWELLRYASWGNEKGSGTKTSQLDYGELNTEYAGLIQLAKQNKVNLGLLQGLAPEFVNKTKTGKWIAEGMNKVPDLVDVTLLHWWDEEKREYMTRIQKFPNKAFRDLEFPYIDPELPEASRPGLTFASMAVAAFPSTSEEDWQ